MKDFIFLKPINKTSVFQLSCIFFRQKVFKKVLFQLMLKIIRDNLFEKALDKTYKPTYNQKELRVFRK